MTGIYRPSLAVQLFSEFQHQNQNYLRTRHVSANCRTCTKSAMPSILDWLFTLRIHKPWFPKTKLANKPVLADFWSTRTDSPIIILDLLLASGSNLTDRFEFLEPILEGCCDFTGNASTFSGSSVSETSVLPKFEFADIWRTLYFKLYSDFGSLLLPNLWAPNLFAVLFDQVFTDFRQG